MFHHPAWEWSNQFPTLGACLRNSGGWDVPSFSAHFKIKVTHGIAWANCSRASMIFYIYDSSCLKRWKQPSFFPSFPTSCKFLQVRIVPGLRTFQILSQRWHHPFEETMLQQWLPPLVIPQTSWTVGLSLFLSYSSLCFNYILTYFKHSDLPIVCAFSRFEFPVATWRFHQVTHGPAFSTCGQELWPVLGPRRFADVEPGWHGRHAAAKE